MSSESPSSSSSSSSLSSLSSWCHVFVERSSPNSESSSSCLIYWLSGWISINLLLLAYFSFKGSSRKSSGLQTKMGVAPSRIKKQKLWSRLVGSVIYLAQPGNLIVPAAQCQNQQRKYWRKIQSRKYCKRSRRAERGNLRRVLFFEIFLWKQYSWNNIVIMFHNNIPRLWTRRSLWRSTTVCWSGQSLTLCSRSTPRRPLARCLLATFFASFKTSRRTGPPWSRSARRSSSTFRICSKLTLVLLAFSYIIPIPDR